MLTDVYLQTQVYTFYGSNAPLGGSLLQIFSLEVGEMNFRRSLQPSPGVFIWLFFANSCSWVFLLAQGQSAVFPLACSDLGKGRVANPSMADSDGARVFRNTPMGELHWWKFLWDFASVEAAHCLLTYFPLWHSSSFPISPLWCRASHLLWLFFLVLKIATCNLGQIFDSWSRFGGSAGKCTLAPKIWHFQDSMVIGVLFYFV